MKTNKQHLLSLIAATALLAACSSVDETDTPLADSQKTEPTAINFNAYVNRSTTRGGEKGTLDATALQTNGFGVFAYYTDNAPYSFTALPNFMYNQQVTYVTDHWTYTPLKYWPNEHGSGAQSLGIDRLSFFAYAPYTAVDDIGYATTDPNCGIVSLTRPNENGYPYVRYYVSTDPSKCVDLCWADPGVNTAATTINLEKPDITTAVTFNFKHALAALNVQIDANFAGGESLDANTHIYVRSITFTGFATKGQLNLYNGAWNNLECDCDVTSDPITIHDGRWDGFEGVSVSFNENPTGLNPVIIQSEKYADTPTAGVTASTVNLFNAGAGDETTPIYVIPTGVPMRVTIVYDVETIDPKLVADYLGDGETHGSSIENRITKEVTLTGDHLIAGNKYTIKLHLGMKSVKVEADVKAWEDGATAPVDLPGNN